MKSRGVIVLVSILGLAMVVSLSGCGQSRTLAPTVTPPASATPTPNVPSSIAFRTLAQYWVADTARGFRLYREFVRINPKPDAITAALRQLVSQGPVDSDYVSLWPIGTTINSVKVNGDTALIDLTFPKLNVGAAAESLAIAQLVWTATAANTTVKKVSLTVDGKKVESLAGHVDATQSFTRAPTFEILPPVWITSPIEGQLVAAKGFTLSGMASTFEANVVWKVIQDGVVIKQGSTTALGAAPAWKPWSIAIPDLAPGTYIFEAMEYSAKDGSLVAQDSKKAVLK